MVGAHIHHRLRPRSNETQQNSKYGSCRIGLPSPRGGPQNPPRPRYYTSAAVKCKSVYPGAEHFSTNALPSLAHPSDRPWDGQKRRFRADLRPLAHLPRRARHSQPASRLRRRSVAAERSHAALRGRVARVAVGPMPSGRTEWPVRHAGGRRAPGRAGERSPRWAAGAGSDPSTSAHGPLARATHRRFPPAAPIIAPAGIHARPAPLLRLPAHGDPRNRRPETMRARRRLGWMGPIRFDSITGGQRCRKDA